MSKVRWPRKLRGGLILLFFILVLVVAFAWQISRQGAATRVFSLAGLMSKNHTEGQYSILVDEKGQVLDMMARPVYINDEFIAADNRRYRVIRVEGNRAICREMGVEQLSLAPEAAEDPAGIAVPVQGGGNQIIGIYYSHEDESYIPSQGSDSIPGNGGIMEVGTAFANRLRSQGLTIIDDRTSHAPHDDGSYRRSRRTAVNLLQKGAAAIFDIHRDGVPDPTFYRRNVNGQDVTMVRMVVGRENQNMGANLDFAKRLKAAADSRYPDLIRGIFIGAGSYNQDLSPRAMLLEIGTHTNTLAEAARGASLFADIVPPVLGVAARPAAARTPSTAADWKGVLFVVLAFVLGGGAFLLISAGSWEKALARLKQFTSIEWVNLLGLRFGRQPALKKEAQEKSGGSSDYQDTVRLIQNSARESQPNDQRADWQKD